MGRKRQSNNPGEELLKEGLQAFDTADIDVGAISVVFTDDRAAEALMRSKGFDQLQIGSTPDNTAPYPIFLSYD